MIKNRFLPIVILLCIATFLVFFRFDQIPQGLAHDENELARTAFSLEGKPYTPFTPIADGHGTPYFYSLLTSFNAFGPNQFALRLPSRIFGILSILLVYFLMKEVFKKIKLPISETITALALSLILLTSRWYIHFTRIALETPFLLFLELISSLTTFLFLKTKHDRYLLLSGIFAGIAFNSYQPGRIFFLVPLLVFFIKKIPSKRICLFYVIPFILVILPMSLYLLQHPGNDIRIHDQFFLKNTSLSLLQKLQYLTSNIQQTALMFITAGDMNGHHNYTGKPALNPIFFGFFIIGLITACRNIRRVFNFFFITYFALALLPTILTYPWENPNMLRTYTALPSIIYFFGQGFLTLYAFLTKKIHSPKVTVGILLLLILISVTYELRTYFIYQPLVFKQAFDIPDYIDIIRQNALQGK